MKIDLAGMTLDEQSRIIRKYVRDHDPHDIMGCTARRYKYSDIPDGSDAKEVKQKRLLAAYEHGALNAMIGLWRTHISSLPDHGQD